MLREFHLRLKALLKRGQLDRDLQDELAYHDEMRRAGSRQAAFGNATLVRERMRDTWSFTALEDLWRDVRHGARVLRRAPGHTLGIVLILALGIGANAAIFSLMNAVFLRDLPVQHPEQLVTLERIDDRGVAQGISYPLSEDLRTRAQSFTGLLAFGGLVNPEVVLTPGEPPVRDTVAVIASGNYFDVLGVRAALGRTFTEDDDRFADPHHVVVLGHAFWRKHFSEDRGVIGQQLYLTGIPLTIIGVTPKEFTGHYVGQSADFWVPLNLQPAIWPGQSTADLRRNYGSSFLTLMGRLKPGVTAAQARAEAAGVHTQVMTSMGDPAAKTRSIRVEDGRRGLSGLRTVYATPLRILMALSGLLLLIACINVASLILARSGARSREVAVRQALGCGRARLFRQFFVESALLAAAGGLGALLLAPRAADALLALAALGVPAQLDLSIDGALLGFIAAVVLACALAFGLAPAWRSTHVGREPAVMSASRLVTPTPTRKWLNRILLVGQVALSVVLVSGAVLFARSLHELYAMDPGFQRQQVVNVPILARSAGYQTPEQYTALAQRLAERLAALPGARSVSVAACGVLTNCRRGTAMYTVNGRAYRPREGVLLYFNEVSNNFFETAGLTIVAGRSLNAGDRAGAGQVAVVNETFVRRYFAGKSPLGEPLDLTTPGRQSIEIVGVVRDSKARDLRETTDPLVFLPIEQFPATFSYVQLKVDGPPEAMLAALRPAILDVDAKLTPGRIETLDQALDRTLARDILLARLSAIFGALALTLACFGVYGVVSYLMTSRTAEIGVRLALGAQPATVLRHVIADAVFTVAPGVGVGLAAAMMAERLIRAQLFGAKAHDPLTYGSVALTLLLTAVMAAYLPARRASRIDPVAALRGE